jgi:CheY-like chemotaxis protein
MTINKHTIIYADDDMDDVFIVKQAFEKHDHITVIHSQNGSEALSILEDMVQQNFLPCLVILDINMPIMDGKEALKAIRNHPKLHKLQVVLFTTSNSPNDIAYAQSLNAILITKPIGYSDLETIAKWFIDQCNFEVNKLSAN